MTDNPCAGTIRSELRVSILDALTKPLTSLEIASLISEPLVRVRQALSKMAQTGAITRSRTGQYYADRRSFSTDELNRAWPLGHLPRNPPVVTRGIISRRFE